MHELDHINLVLHVTMLMFLLYGIISNYGKKIGLSKMAKCVLIWFFVIIFGGVINWGDASSFIGPLLWCIYFLVSFMFFSSQEDEEILKISSLTIGVITLFTGYLTMNIASMINQSGNVSEEYNEFLNIIGFTVTTIPALMTFKNKLLKWAYYFCVAVVAISTVRRMAVISVLIVVALSYLEIRKQKKSKWFSLIIIGGAVFAGFYFITTSMGDVYEAAVERLSFSSGETGMDRYYIWKNVFDASANSNFFELIFGHGTYGVLTVTGHTAAHNEFIEMFFDYGIIGLVLFVLLHFYLIKRTVFLFRHNSEYSYPYLMSYLIMIIYGSFGNVLIYPQYCLPLVMFWGYMEARCIKTYSNKTILTENKRLMKV